MQIARVTQLCSTMSDNQVRERSTYTDLEMCPVAAKKTCDNDVFAKHGVYLPHLCWKARPAQILPSPPEIQQPTYCFLEL